MREGAFKRTLCSAPGARVLMEEVVLRDHVDPMDERGREDPVLPLGEGRGHDRGGAGDAGRRRSRNPPPNFEFRAGGGEASPSERAASAHPRDGSAVPRGGASRPGAAGLGGFASASDERPRTGAALEAAGAPASAPSARARAGRPRAGQGQGQGQGQARGQRGRGVPGSTPVRPALPRTPDSPKELGDLPLIRIEVDYTDFDTISLQNQRFGAQFMNRVANPSDILLFQRRVAALGRSRGLQEGRERDRADADVRRHFIEVERFSGRRSKNRRINTLLPEPKLNRALEVCSKEGLEGD